MSETLRNENWNAESSESRNPSEDGWRADFVPAAEKVTLTEKNGSETSRILPCETVRLLDQTAIERFNVPGILLMENAARGITDILHANLPRNASLDVPSVLIFCGTGNNSGDGLALARHLQIRGIPQLVFLTASPNRFRGDALFQFELAQKLDIPMISLFEFSSGEEICTFLDQFVQDLRSPGGIFLVDALLGTGVKSAPRFPVSALIPWLNRRTEEGVPLLAVDLPSGLNAETGLPFAEGLAVKASLTVTLAAVKPGLVLSRAKPFVGELFLSDIGISVPRLLEECASAERPPIQKQT